MAPQADQSQQSASAGISFASFSSSAVDEGTPRLDHNGEQEEPEELVLPESFSTRMEGVRFCFDYVDKDRSGELDRSEFRTICSKVNPQKNLAEAEAMLDRMDKDKDGLVSWEEFKEAFMLMTGEMTDNEFYFNVRKNVIMEEDLQEGYLHPSKNRKYLERACINSVLSEGLESLIREVYLHRSKIASGTLWDEKGFLPHGYQPLNPLRFLGEYILKKVEDDKKRQEEFREEERKRMELAEMELKKPYADLSRIGKVKLLWNSLVPEAAEDPDSKLPFKDLLTMGKDLGFPLAVVDEILEGMGYDFDEDESPGDLEFFEFEKLFNKFTEEFMDEEVDAYVLLQLGAAHLPYLNAREKGLLTFAKLDEDHSGELEVREIVLFCKMLNPTADEASIRKTVEFLDSDGSQSVDVDEFVSAMSIIMEASVPERVDSAITKILEIGVDALDLATQYMSKPFKAFVCSHASYSQANQLGIKTVFEHMEDEDPIVFVDVRQDEEAAVSRIRGSISIPANTLSKSKGGWTIKSSLSQVSKEDMARMMDEGDEAAGRPATMVVLYDAAGQRSASVAASLSSALNGKVVYNLAGGVIEWFNKFGELVGPDNETPVNAVHPYLRDMIQYVERENDYVMPAATAKSKSKNSSKNSKGKKK